MVVCVRWPLSRKRDCCAGGGLLVLRFACLNSNSSFILFRGGLLTGGSARGQVPEVDKSIRGCREDE